MLETGKRQDVPQIKRGALAAKPESTTLGLQLSFSAETRARPVENDGRATSNSEGIPSGFQFNMPGLTSL